MREAEENEEEKECEGGTKCVKERMKHVRGVNNNGTKYVSWPMDMTMYTLSFIPRELVCNCAYN